MCFLVVLAAAGALIAACGSSSKSSSTATGSAGQTGSASGGGSAFLATAKKAAVAAAAPIKPDVPTTGPKAAAGKSMVLIPCSAAAQGCAALNTWFATAAHVLGWKTLQIDPAGDPGKMADAVQKAINIKANGIYASAIDASTIAAPLAAAKAAGLASVCASCTNTKNLYTESLPAQSDYVQDGYNLTAQAYIDSGGHLKMIMATDSEFGNTRLRQQGALKFVHDCQAAGGDCKIVASVSVLLPNIATSVPNQIVAAARANPDWNALWVPYDAILTTTIPALKSAGVAGHGKAYGFDPIELNLQWIKDGNVEAATVSTPYRWQGFAAADIINRALQGKPVTTEGVRDKLLTKANLPASGAYLGDEDVTAAYKKLWGIG